MCDKTNTDLAKRCPPVLTANIFTKMHCFTFFTVLALDLRHHRLLKVCARLKNGYTPAKQA